MKINATRLQQHFEAMGLIGKIGETGTCRPAHTELEKQGFEIAGSWIFDIKRRTASGSQVYELHFVNKQKN